jgi:hypothetical protein
MRRTSAIVCVVGVLALMPGHLGAQNPTLQRAMQGKLVHAQQLLESVVASDFASMAQPVEALAELDEMEIILWQSAPQPEYRNQAVRFVLAVDGLRQAVADRNTDAVLREYLGLVSSCVQCHAHVRASRTISSPPRLLP